MPILKLVNPTFSAGESVRHTEVQVLRTHEHWIEVGLHSCAPVVLRILTSTKTEPRPCSLLLQGYCEPRIWRFVIYRPTSSQRC